jgi:flagellar basal body-associated protein FliL
MTVNNLNSERMTTRKEYKQAKNEALHVEEKQTREQMEKKKESERKNELVRIRLIPIWLRLVLLMVFMFTAVVAGAVVGYSMLGGGKASDVFKASTWTHIRDLVEKKGP